MEINKLSKLTNDAVFSQIALLHIKLLSAGVLARLGPSFLINLYKALAKSPQSAVYVLQEHEKIIAFVACTANINTFYRQFFYENWTSIFLILPKLFNPMLFKRSFSIFHYLLKKTDKVQPNAELLSIAVAEQAHRLGVGSKLILKVYDFMKENNVDIFKVTAAHTQQSAQIFYQSKGGVESGTIVLGKLKSSIYYFTVE